MAERKRERAKTSGTPASIREALKKATTEMLVLFVLRHKSMYTYEMMQEIDRMSTGKITFNTLYQAIYRLQSFQYIQEEGKVVSEDNRVRIYFAITASGVDYLEKLIEEYRSFTGAVDQILVTDEVRRYLDCPKDEQDRLLLSVNKQVIELQVDNPNLDYDGIVEFLGEPESLAASLMERLSPDVIQKFRKRKRHLRMSAIVCIAAIVIVLSTVLIYTTSIQLSLT